MSSIGDHSRWTAILGAFSALAMLVAAGCGDSGSSASAPSRAPGLGARKRTCHVEFHGAVEASWDGVPFVWYRGWAGADHQRKADGTLEQNLSFLCPGPDGANATAETWDTESETIAQRPATYPLRSQDLTTAAWTGSAAVIKPTFASLEAREGSGVVTITEFDATHLVATLHLERPATKGALGKPAMTVEMTLEYQR